MTYPARPRTSAPAHVVLPARVFHNGLARAIVELRRRLALGDERPPEAAADIDALAQSPHDSASLAGQSGFVSEPWYPWGRCCGFDATPAGIADAQARLWVVALALDGALPEPSEKAVEHARDALRRALEQRAQGEKNDSEVDRDIRRLADALARRLADIAKKAVHDGKMPPFDPHQAFHMPSLDKLMQQMQQAEQRGDHAEAQRKLAEIEKLLGKLRDAKVLTPQQAKEAEKAGKQQRQQMGAVQDMVQREAGLMDNAQHRAPRPGPLAPEYNPEGMTPPPDADQLEANEEKRGADARTQRALGRSLDAVKEGFGAAGGKVPPSMDEATKDMDAATGALTAGQEGAARLAEGRAIADLQKGGKSMGEQMAANSPDGDHARGGAAGRRGRGDGAGWRRARRGGRSRSARAAGAPGHGRARRGRWQRGGAGQDGGGAQPGDPGGVAAARGRSGAGARGAGLYRAVVEAVLALVVCREGEGVELGGMSHSPQAPPSIMGLRFNE